jgi:hypothetical protein
MISVGFTCVSKKRPCRVCRKPTYWGFSRDEGTSICMRVSSDLAVPAGLRSRGLLEEDVRLVVNQIDSCSPCKQPLTALFIDT